MRTPPDWALLSASCRQTASTYGSAHNPDILASLFCRGWEVPISFTNFLAEIINNLTSSLKASRPFFYIKNFLFKPPPQALCSDKLKQRNVAALLRCVSLGCPLLLDEFVDGVRECEAWTDFLCVHATTMLELEYANTAAMATPKRSFFPFLCQDE